MISNDLIHVDRDTVIKTASMLLKHYPPSHPGMAEWVEAARMFGYRLLKRADGDPGIKAHGEFYFMRSV